MNTRAPSWVGFASDGLRLSLICGVAYYTAVGEPQTAYGMALVATTAVALRFARAQPWVDLTFVALLSLDTWLTASGAMERISRDDHTGHFLLAAALVPMIAALLVRVSGDSLTRTPLRLVAIAVALAIGTGLAWELVEYASDSWLGTNMSLSANDSAFDLLADVLGALTGGVVTYVLWRSADRAATEDQATHEA